MDISLHYENVFLKPNYNSIKTRSDISTQVSFLGKTFRLPVVPANMKCCVDFDVCQLLDSRYYFYVMHRFDHDIFAFVKDANEAFFNYVSISVGIQEKDKALINNLAHHRLRVDFITIDVAHGHHSKVADQVKFIKDKLPKTKVIAGNVATRSGVEYLAVAGADAVKVGIGGGYACTTKDKTGFTYPMFSCVMECTNNEASNFNIPVIADGGVRCNGDITKAIVAGAKMVMCGSIFAACSDSPAPVVKDTNGRRYKQYYGSASVHNKIDKKNIEGTMKLMDTDSFTYEEKLLEITQDLQSAISYAGGCNLNALNLSKVNYGVRI
jgi:GMP reductase